MGGARVGRFGWDGQKEEEEGESEAALHIASKWRRYASGERLAVLLLLLQRSKLAQALSNVDTRLKNMLMNRNTIRASQAAAEEDLGSR